MFGGVPKTSRDLMALALDWQNEYTGYRDDQDFLRRDIIRRVHAAGGYDLVGLFAKMVGIPRKQALAIARAERKRAGQQQKAYDKDKKIAKEAAELAEVICGWGGGEYREARRDNTASKAGGEINPTRTGRRQSGPYDPGLTRKNSVTVYIGRNGMM